MRLTLRQLEIFVAIAKTENVSRAAAALAMSQSAASGALVELERLFDCPLFDRVGKSLRINATGSGLLPRAEALLAQARDTEAYLAGGQPGPLNVDATLSIGNYLANLLVAEYMRRHAGARIGFHVSNTETIVARLLNFDTDLGLVEGDVAHPDLLVEPWLDDELVVFCAPGHALAGATANAALLKEQAWILRERGSGTRGQFDRIIAAPLGGVDVRLELEHTESIKRVVESGLGISCLSRLSLNDAFRRGNLVEIPTPDFDLSRRFSLVRHRQRYVSTGMHRFLDLCAEAGGPGTRTQFLALDWLRRPGYVQS